jgi:hypothetical protein
MGDHDGIHAYLAREVLRRLLAQIVEADQDYARRYPLVLQAMTAAVQVGYAAGVGLDPNEPDWPVVYIELPTGQVSWYMPAHPVPYDGHSTAEKHQRIADYRASGGGS